MKKIKLYLLPVLMLAGVTFLASCKKETTADLSQTVKETYPVITLIGPDIQGWTLGTPYSDSGATVYDELAGTTSPISGDISGVDVNSPGSYPVTFHYKNSNGFETTVIRIVFISSADPSIDLSGTYFRVLGGVADPARVMTISHIGPGIYKINNPGGVPPGSAPPELYYSFTLFHITDNTFDVPTQYPIEGGDFTVELVNETMNATRDTLSYIVNGDLYGAATRIFVKQ